MAKRPQNREERKQRDEAAERKRRNEKLLNAQLREADKVMQSIIDKEDISLENYADKLQLSALEVARIERFWSLRIDHSQEDKLAGGAILEVKEVSVTGEKRAVE